MAARVIRWRGACTFAEDPVRESIDARLLWDAGTDSCVLRIAALPVDASHVDRFDHDRFARWLVVVPGLGGREHAVFSDGYRRIRVDIEEGSLFAGSPIQLHYRLEGAVGGDAEAELLPLRQLAGLFRTGRFLPALFPPERRVERLVMVLRVSDALSEGASQREIAACLFGVERMTPDWRTVSDSLRSRVRRLVREARHMAAGGYRAIVRRGRGPEA